MSVFHRYFRGLAFVFMGFLSFACASNHKPSIPISGTDIDSTISVDKVQRRFRVHLPEGVDKSDRSPLIIALHGYKSTGPKLQSISQFDAFAAPHKMITVYPEGKRLTYPGTKLNNHGWNSGFNGRIDDVAFIRKLISYLIDTYNVDPDRVYLVGASNGGMMSFTFACAHPEMIAGFASVVGTMPARIVEGCKAHTPFNILHIQGTGDKIVKYEGNPPYLLPAKVGVDLYKTAFQCNSELKETLILDQILEDGTKVTRFSAVGCKSGVNIIHYAVEGGGHTWFASQKTPDLLAANEFSASRIVFNFFKDINKQ